MKALAGALTATLVLLTWSGGVSAAAPPGSCPPKSSSNPFELYPVSNFPGIEFIDLNENGSVCAFRLPFNPNAFQVIDDVAQVP